MTNTLNLSCTICLEEYEGKDEIISTYCGHIFHNSCYQVWNSQSRTCPECRVENTQTHRAYLHIETPTQQRVPPQKQIELENKISLLEHQLAESENNFLKLEETYYGKEEEILDLQTEIDYQKTQNSSLEEELSNLTLQLQDNEKNLLNALEQINESDKSLKDKDIENDLLKLQNENQEEKIEELQTQHDATIYAMMSFVVSQKGLSPLKRH